MGAWQQTDQIKNMKTLTCIIALLLATFTLDAQNGNRADFGSDETIHIKTSENQRNIRLGSAFNGWMYAYTINDTVASKGGIYVGFSKDNGVTWNKFVTYQFPNSRYPLTDLVVTGTDTAHLNVFLAGVLKNTVTSRYTLYIDRFDGRNGALLTGQVFVANPGLSQVTDISLASDYLLPGTGNQPYGVSMLYAQHNILRDSLFYVSSSDAGSTFHASKCIASAAAYMRKISLAYGKSSAYPGGAYFAAWDLIATPGKSFGHIYTSHSTSVTNIWGVPLCMDSLSSSTNNLVRNPSIACQYSNSKNDSNGLSAIVTFERASGANLQNTNILGYYNMKAMSSTHWSIFSVSTAQEKDLSPNTIFDPSTNNFLLTYYDSTDGRLPYAKEGFNMATPSGWTYISNAYNDQNNNLKNAIPHVVFNLVLAQAGFVWIAENPNNHNGIAMFDAEYAGLATGIAAAPLSENRILMPYPNPASNYVEIPLTLDRLQGVEWIIYDMVGKEVMALQKTVFSFGNQILKQDLSSLPGGVYFLFVRAGVQSKTFRLLVSR
jgi:hypothetical protein